MSIVLRSGTEYITIDSTDKYYSSFIDGIKEATGVLPEMIDVDEMVMKQWDAWQGLRRWLNPDHEVFGYIPSPKLGEAVVLADVEFIMMYLINTDKNWLRYVYVDDKTSKENRLRHYRTVGRSIRQDKTYLFGIVKKKQEHFHGNFNLQNDPVYMKDITEDELEESLDIDWLNIATGILHNARVQEIGEGTREVDKVEVNWSMVTGKKVAF